MGREQSELLVKGDCLVSSLTLILSRRTLLIGEVDEMHDYMFGSTMGFLGEIRFQVRAESRVPGLGRISFDVKDAKLVGYGYYLFADFVVSFDVGLFIMYFFCRMHIDAKALIGERCVWLFQQCGSAG